MVYLSQPVLGDNQSISLLTRRRSWIVSLKTNCHKVCLFFLSSQICYENPDFNLETYAKKSGWKFFVLYLTFTKQAMNNNNYSRRSWIVSLKINCHKVCLFFLSSQICYENPDFNLETYAKKSGWKFFVLYLTFTKQAMNNNNYNKSIAFWWKGEKMKNTRVNPSPLRREFISIFRYYVRQSGN